mmetsp:Transcript_33762/g.44542  ORF Transcript_33762/g.44542 Transcript_33762/m.44542 type:complete len:398 (+) Transcript_33762:218-1411(+)|eukprot:CAMPEP_0117761824 /NCGR_PEP_ID=MMETSP0947-20121206/17514_1 /TAXON_ID=44440 /ORGANISM="Chattonella subsalsa, Strain CCMP2191" /LENGTH=397 /DNA_ID=CAMNT_0005582897 /DNA_START=180 /DNA_END=1373 /DNA_ORIENTATION=+
MFQKFSRKGKKTEDAEANGTDETGNKPELAIQPEENDIEAAISPSFQSQKNVETVQDSGPQLNLVANLGDGIPNETCNMTPDEIIKEVGSADLCDIFRKILENGIIVKCHTEFQVKDLKLWMKEGEDELRYKTIHSKMVHVAHKVELDKILFVQKGKRTKAHMLSPKASETHEDCCLSLLWRGGSLDLECESESICDALVKGFNLLITGEPVLYDEEDDDQKEEDPDLEGAYEDIKREFGDDQQEDEEDIDEEQMENLLRHFIEALRIGVDVVTHNREYSRDARLWIGDKKERLWWKSKKATALPHSVAIDDILLIEAGKKTTAFLNTRGQKAEEDDCFSLLMVGGKTLNLEIEDKVVKKALFEGFKLLIKAAKDGTLLLITAGPAGESLVHETGTP